GRRWAGPGRAGAQQRLLGHDLRLLARHSHVPAGPLQHALDRQARSRAPGERTEAIRAGAPQEGPCPDLAHPPTILILFSDTGGGHRAAARSLDDALPTVEPAADAVWVDPLIGPGP